MQLLKCTNCGKHQFQKRPVMMLSSIFSSTYLDELFCSTCGRKYEEDDLVFNEYDIKRLMKYYGEIDSGMESELSERLSKSLG